MIVFLMKVGVSPDRAQLIVMDDSNEGPFGCEGLGSWSGTAPTSILIEKR